MKNFKVGAYLAGMVFVGLGVAMAVTNPNQEAYNQYAARRLAQYLQEEECVKIEDSVRDLCKLLEREQGQNLLRQLIASNTERQNYLLLSIYKTNLSTSDVLPSFLSGLLSLPSLSYQFETVGLFSNFQIYKAERE
jgi:uncharacterized membrane-anchored protein